ncbi:MAG TPA: XdhC family protein, partial [Dokdonella sp.]|uniref:XdhC family protein n=1 Tax=Dokdonella sp. TaxID=2291710 RepID=UPI002D8044B4
GLIDCANRLAEQSVDAVVGVVIEISGSSARKCGAMSLFDGRGHQAGTLAGGGLERSLAQSARQVLATGYASLLVFDSADDSSNAAPGSDQPGDSLRILMLPMPSQSSPLRDALVSACRRSAWLRLRLELGGGQFAPGFGEARIGAEVFGFDNRGLALEDAHAFDRHVTLSLAPPPRIALLGGGAESLAIVRQAHLLGWFAEVVDARADAVTSATSRQIDQQHDNKPESLPTLLSERHFDAVIIGGHDFDIDLAHLRQLGACGIGYIGLLGPPERREALLARVGDIVATQLEPRLYAPAGLRLGGDGPEVTALAIIAQLQYYFSHDAHA